MLTLDMLNFRIHDVHVDDFNEFIEDLNTMEYMGVLTVNRTFGKGFSQYKYNLHIGQGDGAIFIGYHHNGDNPKLQRERFDMKVEFNPAKHDFDKYKMFWVCLSKFRGFKKTIRGLDLAFDFEKDIKDCVPLSLTGKEMNKFKTTYYFGTRGKDGYLKVYDKGEEEGSDQVKTRVEYTVKLPPDINIQLFSKIDSFNIDSQYNISFIDYDKFDAELACVLFAIHSGFKQVKDFTRRKREKIKKALEDSRTISFDDIYKENKDKIIKQIEKIFKFDVISV